MKFNQVHRYLGLSLALIMLVISVTGTMLLWKREYLWITIPQARHDLQLSPIEVSQAVSSMQAHYAEFEMGFVQLGSENLSLHRVFLSDKKVAWHDHNGKQLALWTGNDRLEDWLLDLHHRFLLGNTVGLNIAGFGGLLMIPLMLIGLCLWWPRRRFLRLGIWPKSASRGVWLRSHGNIGAIAFIPVLLVSISGVILVYPIESQTVLLNGFKQPVPVVRQEFKLNHQPNLLGALQIAEERFVGSTPRWISLPNVERRSFTIGVQADGEWSRMGTSSLTFYSDGRLSIADVEDQFRWKQMFDFSYPFHTGKFEWYVRLILSVFGLALGLLCVLGVTSYIKKVRT